MNAIQPRTVICSGVLLLLILMASQLSAWENQTQQSPPEVSGIVIHKDYTQSPPRNIFSVVSDRSNGAYFKNFLSHLPARGAANFPVRTLRASIQNARGATDLEDIDVLATEVVVLSEDAAKIYSERGVVVDYSGIQDLREVDDSYGLEGLTIRVNGDSFRVAVLFEGGADKMKGPRSPRLFVHDVDKKYLQPNNVLRASKKQPGAKFSKIDYSELCKLTGEKHPTKFRAPALVWTNLPNGKMGFIVLISVDEKDRYDRKFLIRCDESGNIIGDALALNKLGMNKNLVGRNWEGMCWSADNQSLSFVDDARTNTKLFTLKKRAGW